MAKTFSQLKKWQRVVYRILSVINRFAHFLDLGLFIWIADYLNATTDNQILAILVYALPIVQLIRAVKWEWRIFRTKGIIKTTALNGRVMAFSGKQGAGKTSFMLYMLSVMRANVYSNFPCRIRGKFSKVLERDILALDSRIPDGSVTVLDEATLLYHNLQIDPKKVMTEHNELFAQEVCQQLVRHFFDGNMFYSSVDITRLPQILKENIGLTNFMLGQDSIRLSFATGIAVELLGRLFGIKIDGSVRVWDVQQLERIPEKGYVFDLSNQEKDTNTNHFANLIRFCAFNTSALFEYDDRFMRGCYAELPEHIDTFWQSLDFSPELLRKIGYGKILDFFDDKKKKQKKSNFTISAQNLSVRASEPPPDMANAP